MNAVIIIPTYNEKGNIGRLLDVLQGIIKTLPGKFNTQILVVDDSSPDGTSAVVKDKQATLSHIHLLVNPQKSGLGGAYLKGMAYAVDKLNADVLIEFDADFSHDPQKLPAFLEKIAAGYDLVLGSRYIPGGSIPQNWGLHRKFLSVIGNLIIRTVMLNFSIHDWTTGYRAIKKEVYESVKNELNQERFFGYAFQIGFLHKTLQKGFKVGEVPIDFIDRTKGESKLGPEYIKNTLIYIFKARLLEIIHSRFIKFGIVGGTGLVLQTILFELLGIRLKIFTPVIATIIGGQVAIISNYLLNNIWTFRDKIITTPIKLIWKFIQFFLTSNFAVLVLQGGSVTIGEILVAHNKWGLRGFYFLRIFITIVFNYTIYNRFIWKTHKAN